MRVLCSIYLLVNIQFISFAYSRDVTWSVGWCRFVASTYHWAVNLVLGKLRSESNSLQLQWHRAVSAVWRMLTAALVSVCMSVCLLRAIMVLTHDVCLR